MAGGTTRLRRRSRPPRPSGRHGCLAGEEPRHAPGEEACYGCWCGGFSLSDDASRHWLAPSGNLRGGLVGGLVRGGGIEEESWFGGCFVLPWETGGEIEESHKRVGAASEGEVVARAVGMA